MCAFAAISFNRTTDFQWSSVCLFTLITKHVSLLVKNRLRAIFFVQAYCRIFILKRCDVDHSYAKITFRYLILAIGLVGLLYFVAQLLQDNDELNWVEIISVLGMIGMMSYSNIQSHRELVMRSKKDYQEFIETLIQFNTHVIEEVPLLKIVATLEQMKKEMEECMRELNELGVETSEIRETDEGGVEESKGAEKSLMQRVEERLQSLIEERDKEIEAALQLDLAESIHLQYQLKARKIVSKVNILKDTIQQYQTDFQQLHELYKIHAVLNQKCRSIDMSDDQLQSLMKVAEMFNVTSAKTSEKDDSIIMSI